MNKSTIFLGIGTIFLVFFACLFLLNLEYKSKFSFRDSFTYGDNFSVAFSNNESFYITELGLGIYFPELLKTLSQLTEEPLQYGIRSTFIFYADEPKKGNFIGEFHVDRKLHMESLKTEYNKYQRITISDAEAYFEFSKTSEKGMSTISVKLIQPSEKELDILNVDQLDSVSYRVSSRFVPIFCVKTIQIVPVLTNEKNVESLGLLETLPYSSEIIRLERGMLQARYMLLYRGATYQ